MAFSHFGVVFMAARKRRARLLSGDLAQANEAVSDELATGFSPQQYRCFAYAALGELSSARRGLLAKCQSGEVVARDYGLCSCVLMAAFENDAGRALRYAEQLLRLPLEGERHHARRCAVISVARVLAGVVDEEDWEYLNAAPVHEPVMLWPCRYAAASMLDASGQREQVLRLIGSAPAWPETSHFARLHAQLLGHPRDARGRSKAA
jgi:hypothetical protein